MTFQVVSVDMFRTLVDLSKVENTIWPAVLGETYSPRLAEECATRAATSLFNYISPARFSTCKQVFAACFSGLFAGKGLNIDPSEAASLWAERHRLSPAFDDAAGFLSTVGAGYRLCLASDTDDDMLGPLKTMYAFDHVFTSEQLGCYKAYGDGRYFHEVVKHYGVKPSEILHIGDGVLEMIGAKKAGLAACWLNRNGSPWTQEVKPDFEVTSLSEVPRILGRS